MGDPAELPSGVIASDVGQEPIDVAGFFDEPEVPEGRFEHGPGSGEPGTGKVVAAERVAGGERHLQGKER